MTRARGFTLIELMISLALAGLVVGGAMQLHASFNRQTQRQNQVAEMQQTLRVSMLILERAIRQAGQGVPGGAITESHGSPPNCNGTPVTHYAFQWSNKNDYVDPIVPTKSQITDGTATTIDPDWFYIMYANQSSPVYAANDTAGINLGIYNPQGSGGIPPDLSDWNDGDLFAVVFPPGVKCGAQDCGTCVREISQGAAHGGNGKDKLLQHNPAQANRCYNYTNKADPCLLDPWPGGNPVPVTHLSGMITAYRVMPVNDPLNPTLTPKLTMRTAPMGTAYDAASPPWTIIAENIEDMQLALIMYDGRICYSVDDPAQCKPTEAVAVRVTLVARSSTSIPGVTDSVPVFKEDEPANTARDGFLRRAVTSQIQLRNMPGKP